MNNAAQTKEIEYAGQVERYEIVDGWREMFLGYVHTCKRLPPPNVPDALRAEWAARYGA